MNVNKILQTDSIQEFADFWDTHDLTDFDAELEEVDEPVFDRQTTVTVRHGSPLGLPILPEFITEGVTTKPAYRKRANVRLLLDDVE